MFDQEKLNWLNGHYIREADTDRLAGLLGERLASLGVDTDPSVVRDGAALVQERSRTVNEAAGMLRFLFEEAEPNDKARKLLAGQKEYLETKAFQPIRAAVTFSNVSPPLFESLALLGRERTMDRLRSAAG